MIDHLDLTGLDLDSVRYAAEELRDSLNRSTATTVDLQPGNSTRYAVMVVPAWMLGDLPEIDERRATDQYVLALLNGTQRCQVFNLGDEPFPSYLMEKFGVGEGDATVLAALIAAIGNSDRLRM